MAMNIPRSTRVASARLSIGAILLTVPAGPANAQDRPDHYVLATEESDSWTAEARILVDWDRDKPVMTGLECVTRADSESQNGKPPLEIGVRHPVESGEYKFQFTFNLPDSELTDRTVETITVGGRPYHRRVIQSRIIPYFGGSAPDGIVLSYGIGRDMFRPTENYPWLPVEFMIPQFFEVEGITLGISGQFEIEHGEYEKRFETLYIHMDGFRETLSWCYAQVNPAGGRKLEFPAALTKKLEK
jgi:hypothetical protein